MARKDVSLLSKVSAPNGSIEDAAAAVFGPKEKLKEELADMMATEPTAEPATAAVPATGLPERLRPFWTRVGE